MPETKSQLQASNCLEHNTATHRMPAASSMCNHLPHLPKLTLEFGLQSLRQTRDRIRQLRCPYAPEDWMIVWWLSGAVGRVICNDCLRGGGFVCWLSRQFTHHEMRRFSQKVCDASWYFYMLAHKELFPDSSQESCSVKNDVGFEAPCCAQQSLSWSIYWSMAWKEREPTPWRPAYLGIKYDSPDANLAMPTPVTIGLESPLGCGENTYTWDASVTLVHSYFRWIAMVLSSTLDETALCLFLHRFHFCLESARLAFSNWCHPPIWMQAAIIQFCLNEMAGIQYSTSVYGFYATIEFRWVRHRRTMRLASGQFRFCYFRPRSRYQWAESPNWHRAILRSFIVDL